MATTHADTIPQYSAVHTILILAWQQGHRVLSAAVESFLPRRAVCRKPYVCMVS